MSVLNLQKKRRFKSAKHLAWVRTLGCSAMSISCEGPVQAHHLLRPWAGSRGMGLKADDRNAIPLCLNHHLSLHQKYGSEDGFFRSHARPSGWAKKLAESIFDESKDLNSLKIN